MMRSLALLSLAAFLVAGGLKAEPVVKADDSPSPLSMFAAVAAYDVTDLGTLGGCCSWATGINANRQVVGWSINATGQQEAFLWSPDRGMVGLGHIGGGRSVALGVNDLGQVVGWSVDGLGEQYAFLWSASTGMRNLGAMGCFSTSTGSFCSLAAAVNGRGEVAGWTFTASGQRHAFLWTPSGGMRDLGTLGGVVSNAWGINGLGQVVGESSVASGEMHAFLWSSSMGMRDVGTLEGAAPSLAFDLNDESWVVGQSAVLSGDRRAFLWSATGGMADLGTLGGLHSFAHGVNSLAQVVGWSNAESGDMLGALWAPGGVTQELPTLGGTYGTARDINGSGQIAGFSADGNGNTRATLWVLREEPPPPPPPPPPSELCSTPMSKIDCLIAEITSLRDASVVNHGQANALIAKLNAAKKQLGRENARAAANILRAFSNQVHAFIHSSILEAEQGGALVSDAGSIVPQGSRRPSSPRR